MSTRFVVPETVGTLSMMEVFHRRKKHERASERSTETKMLLSPQTPVKHRDFRAETGEEVTEIYRVDSVCAESVAFAVKQKTVIQ